MRLKRKDPDVFVYNISARLQNEQWAFPGGPVIKNPPANAGDLGLIPGQGTKIPHALAQLSLGHHSWRDGPRLQGKIPPAATRTRHSQINKYQKK